MERRDFPDWVDAVTYAVRVYTLCGAHLTVRWDCYALVWSAVWTDRLPTCWGDDHD